MKINIIIDNNQSPTIAKSLAPYFLLMEIGEAIHLQDKYPPDIPDIELIKNLQNTGETWLLISGDRQITRNSAERHALNMASNVKLLLFKKSLMTADLPTQISKIYGKIDEIIAMMQKPNPPKVLTMTINGRIETLSI